MTSIKQLETLAYAATPGEWEALSNCRVWAQRDFVCDADNSVENSHYIAAANPQTVLKLIEVIRVQQYALEAIAESQWDASAGLLRNIANAALANAS